MNNITEEYKKKIEEKFQENQQSAYDIKNYLEHSSVAYHGRCVFTLHIPKVFTAGQISDFKEIVKTTYGIFEKVIKAYLTDPDFRKLFPFSKELEKLILVPNLYDSLLPIARFDIFYNEETGDFKFCEINTDGTSAMNEDYVLNMAIAKNTAHQEMLKKYSMKTFELYDSWVKCFMKLYDSYQKKVDHPRIGIVDFLADASITEFEEFKRRFEKAGYETEICEITELSYHDGALYSASGKKIDLIYRRAVTSDIMKRIDEVRDFIEAVKNQDVCIMGSFCTQIIHNKWLFKILHMEESQHLFTGDEQKFIKDYVPYTDLLEENNIEEIIDKKEKWIIKPLDSYASKGVFAGIDYSKEEWKKLVEEHCGKEYIFQEYCPPYRSQNIYLPTEDAKFIPYTNMSGLFVYNGEFAGVYSRLSDGGIISSQYNEKAVATLYLSES